MNTKSAQNVKEFVHVLSRDDQGRPTRLLVPGHEGRRYQVKLGRNGELTAHCERLLSDVENPRVTGICKGSLHNICYHILAACMVAAEEQGKEVVWCDGEHHIKLPGNLADYETFSVKSAQSGKSAWGFVLDGEPEPELAEAGLSTEALIALALEKTGDKTQWFVGESVWLTDYAFLNNDDGVVRLYQINPGQKYPQSEMLAVVYRLNPRSGEWKPQAQLTRQQAEAELLERDSAIPVQYERGRGKLFKT